MSSWRVVSEAEFSETIKQTLNDPFYKTFRGVTGPGRSGAVAAVYASHILGVPYITFKSTTNKVSPLLLIDTATYTGKTMRKATNWYNGFGVDVHPLALYHETPKNLVKFWYENV